MRIIYFHLRCEPDPAKRAAILLSAINETVGIYIPALTVSRDSNDERARDPSRQLVSPSDLPALQAAVVEKIRAAAVGASLLSHPRLLYLLYRWKEWDASPVLTDWIKGVQESREGCSPCSQLAFNQSARRGLMTTSRKRHGTFDFATLTTFLIARTLGSDWQVSSGQN
jgi:hypothetical protein